MTGSNGNHPWSGPPGGSAPAWVLIVPVKPTATGKSRLAPYAGSKRPRLAAAMTLDMIQAALSSRPVAELLIVTNDPVIGPAAADLGARLIMDEPDAGLNEALIHGAAVARAKWPEQGIAAMSSDLPALRPIELERALRAAAANPLSFVADTPGIGTTMYNVHPGSAFTPRFGPDSANTHRATGAIALEIGRIDSVRRDVDTETDLLEAIELGVGPRTREVLVRAGALL